MLLAQAAFDPSILFTALWEKGPMAVVFGLVVYLLWTYGGKWFQAQLELIEVLKDCSERNTESLESSARNMEVLANSATLQAKIPRMLGHICEAAKAATGDTKVQHHLDRALDERDR